MLLFALCVAFVPSVESSACTLGQQCLSCTERSEHCLEECYVGFYGNRCDRRCSRACKGKACTLSANGTGVCTEGCNLGYYGSTCRSPCRRILGCYICSRECDEGYCLQDEICFADCQNSYYGGNCTSCSTSCKRCNRATGQCEECKPGYEGSDCTQRCKNCIGQCRGGCSGRCKPGYFGTFCEKSCSEGCKSDCDVKAGACSCKPGWYGKNCMRRCSTKCADGLCDEDGKCSTGCRPGYYGDRCSSQCNTSCIDEDCKRELCSKCNKGKAVCKRNCKRCLNSCRDECYRPWKVCTDICESTCSRNECDDKTRLVISTDETGEEGHHPESSPQDNSVTLTTLVAIVASLVVVVIVVILYFLCFIKRFKRMIFRNVQVRRQNVVENSAYQVSTGSTHEYAEIVSNAKRLDDQDVDPPMPVVRCSRTPPGDEAKGRNALYEDICYSKDSAYIRPVHVSS